MKKWILLVLALLLALSLTGSALAQVNAYGWEVPEKTLKIDVFNNSDNWTELEEQKLGIKRMQDYLKEQFNIEYTYSAPSGKAEEEVNLMLAAGNYPGVMRSITTAARQKFVEQGKAIDLTPYIENSPNLKAALGDMINMYKDADGKIYYLPTSFGNLMDLPDYSAHIRYDEWLAIGSPKIETPEDYFNALMAIYEKFPTTPNGDTRYTLSLYNNGLPEYISGYWGFQRGWQVNDDKSVTYWAMTDEGKEMARFFNNWWRTGTMDPDAFTNEWNDLRTKISQERVIGMIGGWWIGYNAGHEIWSLTNDDWHEEMRFIQVGFKAPEAEHAYVTTKNNLGSNWTVITDKAEDPEAIVRFLDFNCTDVGKALLNWGVPGYTPSFKDAAKQIAIWHMEGTDNWHFDKVAKAELLAETWDYNDEGVFGANTGLFTLVTDMNRWADGEHSVWPNQMWYSENRWKQIMFENMSGTIFDSTALLAFGDMPQDVSMAKTAVEDTYKQYYPLVCMAEDDATFDAAWEAFQDALKTANIDLWTQFRSEAYLRNATAME